LPQKIPKEHSPSTRTFELSFVWAYKLSKRFSRIVSTISPKGCENAGLCRGPGISCRRGEAFQRGEQTCRAAFVVLGRDRGYAYSGGARNRRMAARIARTIGPVTATSASLNVMARAWRSRHYVRSHGLSCVRIRPVCPHCRHPPIENAAWGLNGRFDGPHRSIGLGRPGVDQRRLWAGHVMMDVELSQL